MFVLHVNVVKWIYLEKCHNWGIRSKVERKIINIWCHFIDAVECSLRLSLQD